MQTIKLKYESDVKSLVLQYQRQYSSCLHYFYNRIVENPKVTEHELRTLSKTLNHVELIDAYLMQCAISEAKQLYSNRSSLQFSISDKKKKKLQQNQIDKLERQFEEHRYKMIFGGKKNYFARLEGKISKEEWDILKLNPLYVMGDAVNKGNRKFQIQDDLETVIWKPNKGSKYTLKLKGIGNRLNIIKKLYLRQLSKDLAITYKIDQEYIYISFDEDKLYETKLNYGKVNNRVLGIDLNPNYIGWSIVDWKDESEYKVIKSGIYKIKDLNDYKKKFKGQKSNSKDRIWLSNKRNYETVQIVKNIINKTIYYKVQLISIEDLNIKSKDMNKGKNYNELCNNSWLRNTFVNNITKRCKILGIDILKVKPEYSSFIGNFLYRELNLPDMILASIEISRRGYEFYNQYITKNKEIKKNIIRPNLTSFKEVYYKSLEEFGLQPIFKDLIDLYYNLKESEIRYRLSIDNFNLQFSRFYSNKSLISVI